jgi:hypothetical protein
VRHAGQEPWTGVWSGNAAGVPVQRVCCGKAGLWIRRTVSVCVVREQLSEGWPTVCVRRELQAAVGGGQRAAGEWYRAGAGDATGAGELRR